MPRNTTTPRRNRRYSDSLYRVHLSGSVTAAVDVWALTEREAMTMVLARTPGTIPGKTYAAVSQIPKRHSNPVNKPRGYRDNGDGTFSQTSAE